MEIENVEPTVKLAKCPNCNKIRYFEVVGTIAQCMKCYRLYGVKEDTKLINQEK